MTIDADAFRDSGATCCPRDSTPSGCTNLGGSRGAPDACGKLCDVWCSTNWRVERDENGCEVWRFDKRSPASGENFFCRPDDAGD